MSIVFSAILSIGHQIEAFPENIAVEIDVGYFSHDHTLRDEYLRAPAHLHGARRQNDAHARLHVHENRVQRLIDARGCKLGRELAKDVADGHDLYVDTRPRTR